MCIYCSALAVVCRPLYVYISAIGTDYSIAVTTAGDPVDVINRCERCILRTEDRGSRRTGEVAGQPLGRMCRSLWIVLSGRSTFYSLHSTQNTDSLSLLFIYRFLARFLHPS